MATDAIDDPIAAPRDASDGGGRLSWDNPARTRLMARVRPEGDAGGYVRDDPAIVFYHRIHALLTPAMSVLDFGCGRGTSIQPHFQTFHAEIQRLQGKCAKLVGVDVDEGVMHHPSLDERAVIEIGKPVPYPDQSFDIIISQWVLEHIDDPAGFSAEIGRLLKPGGWFCGLTPNKFGYVGLATQMLPNNLHNTMLHWLWPERADRDVFPTRYRLNTLGALRRYFPEQHWVHGSYIAASTPRYHCNSYLLFSLIDFYQRAVPPFFGTDMMIFLQKK